MVLIDVYKNNQLFCKWVGFIRDLGKRYNEFERIQKTRHYCPEHVPTRWVNDLDIAFFLYKHKNDALTRAGNEKHREFITSGKLQDMVVILLPFRASLQTLESSKCKISDIYQTISNMISYYDAHDSVLVNCDSHSIIETIQTCLKFRVSSKKEFEIIQLAYTLTPAGRTEIRENLKEGSYQKDTFNIYIENSLNFELKYVRTILKDIGSPLFFDSEEEDDDDVEEINDLENMEEENIIDESEEDDLIHGNNYRTMLEIATNVLCDISELMNIDKDAVIMEYTNWIYGKISDPMLICNKIFWDSNVGYMWRILENDNYPNLSKISRLLHSIIASESCNERGFSKRKYIQNRRRTRMSTQLANALLTLS